MNDRTKLKILRIVMVAVGIFSLVGVPIVVNLWPSGWLWKPSQPEYEGMIGAIYAGFALCLLWAVRNPVRHIIIVWGFIISSLFHGSFMAFLALTQQGETAHLTGDVPFNFAVAVLLLVFMPWRLVRGKQET